MAAIFASTAGLRSELLKVWPASRMRLVSTASAESTVQHSSIGVFFCMWALMTWSGSQALSKPSASASSVIVLA